jgi:hypothetical protein
MICNDYIISYCLRCAFSSWSSLSSSPFLFFVFFSSPPIPIRLYVLCYTKGSGSRTKTNIETSSSSFLLQQNVRNNHSGSSYTIVFVESIYRTFLYSSLFKDFMNLVTTRQNNSESYWSPKFCSIKLDNQNSDGAKSEESAGSIFIVMPPDSRYLGIYIQGTGTIRCRTIFRGQFVALI